VRSVTAVLVLSLAACSSAGGEPTTTAPLTEPSTTSVRAPSTTTTTEPTTTANDECADGDGDGVLRNRRGFVCPPHLRTLEFIRLNAPAIGIYLPGTYETRLFSLPLRFTRDEQFTSLGENAQSVSFEYPSGNSRPGMDAWTGDAARQFGNLSDMRPVNRPDDWVWTEDIETGQVQVDGYPAAVTVFTANCLDETKTVQVDVCFLNIPALGDVAINLTHGERTAMIVLDSPEPVTFTVSSDARHFDTYWNDVALPILDSIEFLDR
jgi:hypothetical protein